MSDNTILAESRENFGKGAARRIRAANKIPAVIYGHGSEPQHVTLPGHEISLLLRKSNAIIDLDLNGAKQLVLVKDVQKDPVRQIIEHIDLIVVRLGEKVTVDITVHVTGESYPGSIVQIEQNTVSLESEATNIPERIYVSIEGATVGTQILAKDLDLPEGSSLLTDPDSLVLHVTEPSGLAGDSDDAAAPAAAAE
jgi:large subunit ribosomal protein L25